MPLLDRVFDRSKSGPEVLAKLSAYLTTLQDERTKKINEKTLEGVSRYLAQLKVHLFGNEDHEVTKEGVLHLATEAVKKDLLLLLLQNLNYLDFETRKDVSSVFGALVRVKSEGGVAPGAEYVRERPEILELLKSG
eukprot:351955-Chlamydomonas_euryale.AAC.12